MSKTRAGYLQRRLGLVSITPREQMIMRVGLAMASWVLVGLLAIAIMGLSGCATPPPPAPPAPRTIEELESTLASLELTHRVDLVEIKNTFEKEKAAGALEARRDLIATVKSTTNWLQWIFVVLGVVSLLGVVARLAGLTNPLVSTLARWIPFGGKTAAFFFGCLALTIATRHAMLKWGPTLSDVGFWVVLIGASLVGAISAVPFVWAWIRARLIKQASHLTQLDDPRAATALLTVATGVTGQKASDKTARKSLLQDVQAAITLARTSVTTTPLSTGVN